MADVLVSESFNSQISISTSAPKNPFWLFSNNEQPDKGYVKANLELTRLLHLLYKVKRSAVMVLIGDCWS